MRSYALLIFESTEKTADKLYVGSLTGWTMDTNVSRFSDMIYTLSRWPEHARLNEFFEQNFTSEALENHKAGRYTLFNYVLLVEERK